MKNVFVIGLICLATATIPAFGQAITHSSYRNGHKYTFEVNYGTLKDTPSWNPEKEDAPISLRKAVEIARRNLKTFVPAADDNWNLLKVNLQRIGENKAKWIYQVEFYCFLSKQNCQDDTGSFTIYVKLDGGIVEPIIEPDNEPKNIKTAPSIKIAPTKKP